MPNKKEPPQYVAVGEKDYWHPYNLQSLPPGRFLGVVGKILSGRYRLLVPRSRKQLPLI